MNKLLQIEWLKLKNYRAFKVISLFFVLGIPVGNYLFYIFKKKVIDTGDPTGTLASVSLFSFPNGWHSVSYFSSCMLFLPGLLLLILITNEYTYRTNRQNIIDGMSRSQFINAKLMLAVIFAVFSVVLVMLTALIFGLALGGKISFNGFENVGYFFLKALTYNFIALLFGVLIKRTGFAITAFLMYLLLENGMAVGLYAWAIHIKKDNGGPDLGDMGNYLPMNAADGLIYWPLRSVSEKMASGMPTDYSGLVLILAVIYLILFFIWPRWKFLKSDL